jgi:hypothetical protein
MQHVREEILKPFLKDEKLLRQTAILSAVPGNVAALRQTNRNINQDHHRVSQTDAN